MQLFLFIHHHFVIIFLSFWLKSKNADDSKCKQFFMLSDLCVLPDISVVHLQVLHRNLQNVTQELNCLLPFMPLKKLTELLNGEAILRKIRTYADILWSPQQVHLFYLNLYIPVV